MSADSPRSPAPPAQNVRDALRAIGQKTPPGEQEFAATLHRRLVAAGAPPAVTWFGRVVDGVREPWRELRQQRALITGAILGALVTATAFALLAGPRTQRRVDRSATAMDGRPPGARHLNSSEVDVNGDVRVEHKAHTVGDRRSLRDRLGADLGAERPERPHVKVPTRNPREELRQ